MVPAECITIDRARHFHLTDLVLVTIPLGNRYPFHYFSATRDRNEAPGYRRANVTAGITGFSDKEKSLDNGGSRKPFLQQVTCTRKIDERSTKGFHFPRYSPCFRHIAENVASSRGCSAIFLRPKNRESLPCYFILTL